MTNVMIDHHRRFVIALVLLSASGYGTIQSVEARPEFQMPNDLLNFIDMGFEFGDACVRLPNYPIRVLPPSGVMQIVAYETVNAEVLSRIKPRQR